MKRPDVLLSGKNVTKVFGYGKNKKTAVHDVSFDFHEGEIVSIVGESGSGKTTLAKMLLGLLSETSGEILYKGQPRSLKSHADRKKYWKDIQAIFQDPFSSFNVFYKVERLLRAFIKLQALKM
mgnify:FL=1